MIRTSFGRSRYTAASEDDLIVGTARTWSGQQPLGIVYCHGSGGTATSVTTNPAERLIIDGLARHATVIAADLGLQAWANNVGITRIGEAITNLRTQWGSTGRVVLVAGSMGTANALAYTLAHPENVAGVAGVIPLTDITDVMLRGAAASVNAAYGGAYDDATHGPTHNPVRFAANLTADLPIHLWTTPDDPIVPPATADAFIAARPQTGRTILPPLNHSNAAVAAASASVIEWVRTL